MPEQRILTMLGQCRSTIRCNGMRTRKVPVMTCGGDLLLHLPIDAARPSMASIVRAQIFSIVVDGFRIGVVGVRGNVRAIVNIVDGAAGA